MMKYFVNPLSCVNKVFIKYNYLAKTLVIAVALMGLGFHEVKAQSVSITSPATGTSYTIGSTITVTGTASAPFLDVVTSVVVTVSTASATATGTTSYSASVPTTALSPGTYTLTVTNNYSVLATGIAAGSKSTTISVTLLAAPIIAYTTPQIYTVGAAITTLTPTNTGGAVGTFGFGAGTALTGATLSGPSDMAIDASGNVYVTNYTNNTISKYNSSGTYLGTFGTGATMSAPVDIVFDSSGNAYVLNTATTGTGSVYKYNSAGVYQSTILSGLNAPLGIDIDASNNIYIADAGAGTVKKYNTSGTLILSLPTTNLNTPSGVAVDGTGNIYALNLGGGNVTEYNSAGTYMSTLLTGFNGPYAITTDGAGNIYVADSGNSLVKVYNQSGTLLTSITVTDPEGLVVDNSGNLFVASYSANKVYEFKPTGGYFLNKVLPAGLSFNSSTGSISGTPTAIMAATVYTVTAYNSAGGSGSTTVTITVNNPASAPAISYTTPQIYTVGTAITTLSPTNTGGAIGPFGFGTATSLTGATLNNPHGVGIDASGNIYVTNSGNNTISKYNSSGAYVGTFGSGATMSFPKDIVFDSSGNAYVLNLGASAGAGSVYKYNSSGVYQSTILSGLNYALGLTIDASNNIYVADQGATTVKKYSTSGTLLLSLPTTNLSTPLGVAVDASGNIYVLNNGTGNVTKYNSAGTFLSTFLSGYTSAQTITIDGAGNIYVGDNAATNTVYVYNQSGTFLTSKAVTDPEGIAIDTKGNMYTSSYFANQMNKFAPTGSYFIDKALPAGLNFDSNTGSISGTPTATMAATVYTVTAYNAAGSGSTTLSITVNNPAAYGNYAFQDLITLNTNTLGITSNLTNFPALLSIQDNNLIISGTCADKVQNPNGPNYDLAFVSGGSELYYQLESYNQTTGTLLVWVQIPSLTYATNNTISFYYGSKSPPVTHNAAFFANTWASDYKAVYHFNESSYTGSVTDGTAGAHTGTTSGMTSADLVTGKIGTAYTFNGSSKKITAGTVSITGAFTLSAWVKLGATGLDQKVMTNQDASGSASGGYKLGVFTSNIPEAESGAVGNRSSTPNPTAFASGVWHYIQGVYTGTTLSTYVDGAQYKILTTSNNPSTNLTLSIGAQGGAGSYYFNGIIDEPRVSNVAKTADWVKAEYGDQNSPTTFTTVGSTVTYTTNAAAIAGALTYTWTGATSTDPSVAGNWNNTTAGTTSQLPAFDGTATLVVPAGLSNYPALTVDASLYGLTIASGGSLNLNGHTLSVGCNIYNNATTGGTGILYGSNTASAITWNGTSSAQTFTGANTANTAQLGNMTVNNSSAGTVTITGGPVDVYNTLTLTKGNLVVNNAGNGALTLKSSSALTASVAVIPSSYSITGSVNVERFLTGGNTYSGGRWIYRNYRLMSSPVNAGLVSGKYPYTINYIAASAIVTGAKSSFGTLGGNPTIYVYSEDYTPSNASFTSGNFKGVTDMSTLTNPYTLTISNNGTTKALYVGNGFMFFFRGDKINSVGTSPGKTTYPYVAPESVVFTATGNLNQGSYTYNNWQTGSGLLYTSVAGNSTIMGFNLVGNPYASTIDWEATNSGGIVATNVDPSIYVFNPVNNQYNTYRADSHVGNPGTFTGKIASGQGFFVKATSASASLVFNETAKSTTVINAGSGNLMMGTPAGQAAVQRLFRLRLTIDSLNFDDLVIGFKSTASAKYDLSEDSKYLVGLNAAEGLASYSTDTVPKALAINFLPLPKKAPQVIKLNVTAKNSGRLTLEKTQLDSLPKIYELWLMDKYKKDSLDIRNNTTYIFDIDRNDTLSFGNNRFELVIRQNKALGIHLLDFRAAKATGGVQLDWKVENEVNYTNFTVERSTDNGATFGVLGGFASNSQGTYTFLDGNPANAVNIYRIKIEDLNGTISYTKAIAISYNPGTGLTASTNIAVYPNPAVGLINLNINQPALATLSLSGVQATGYSPTSAATPGSYSIKIINVSGAIIQSATSSQQTWQGDVSALQPGTYVLQVLNNKDKSVVGKTTFVKL